MPTDGLRPARRFLHVCYCCTDAPTVTAFFVDALAMRHTMGTSPGRPSSGAILGLDRDIISSAAFVYDARGPRTSPAIEVQGWVDPPVVGTPPDDPTTAGIQALGFSVPTLDPACARLVAAGCAIRTTTTAWATLVDPRGVALDIVEDPGVPEHETRLRHLRITVTDLARSLPWYEALGFVAVARERFTGTRDVEVARLRLADEPFEAVLTQWHNPASHGRHVSEANHAGLYRTAVGVDDTRGSYEDMTAAGVVFDRPPVSIELRGTPVPDMWICFLRDPDGVPFELVERPRSAFRP